VGKDTSFFLPFPEAFGPPKKKKERREGELRFFPLTKKGGFDVSFDLQKLPKRKEKEAGALPWRSRCENFQVKSGGEEIVGSVFLPRGKPTKGKGGGRRLAFRAKGAGKGKEAFTFPRVGGEKKSTPVFASPLSLSIDGTSFERGKKEKACPLRWHVRQEGQAQVPAASEKK